MIDHNFTGMSWFSKDGEDNKKAPNRSKRRQCWDSRDAYFKCLDKLSIDNALDDKKQQEIATHCGAELKTFDSDCAQSWVKYFKEQRFYAIKKERFMKEMEEKGEQEIPLNGKR